MDYALLVKAFGAFFAIMNPFMTLPIFLAMTSDFTVVEQRFLALKVALYAAIMCAVILLAGQAIIGFFGVSVSDFRIAGGLVLAHIAWSMLNGSPVASHHGSDSEQSHMAQLKGLAFHPITFPMIVGPGTIATIIVFTGQAQGLEMTLTIGIVIAVVLAMLLVVLYFAGSFGKVLSETMRVIMTRLMGMILLAIAVDMIIAGLATAFPKLALG